MSEREEVTAFEPPSRLTGGMLRRALQKFMKDAAQRLAREAQQPN